MLTKIKDRLKKIGKWILDKLDKLGETIWLSFELPENPKDNYLAELFGEAVGNYDLYIVDSNNGTYKLQDLRVSMNGEDAIYGHLYKDYDDKFLLFSNLRLFLYKIAPDEESDDNSLYEYDISYKLLMRYIADAITDALFKSDCNDLFIKVNRHVMRGEYHERNK